eukprot:TRINITY_DN19240_c0_g1_i2.p2 TRINITY_DN19240_c0_g1~~TRINITY_DN19240_c0_g1_i2.p2  ORF type:complete len:120 (+),score=22.33 TRINITY_DN19240_c0_g1_i2:131-490(+)
MLRSLVGSEMCIRDRVSTQSTGMAMQRLSRCCSIRRTSPRPTPALIRTVSSVANLLASPQAYYNPVGAAHFRELELRSGDVVHSSYAKCGTSWMHAVLFALLRMDEQGRLPEDLSLIHI